MKKKHLRYVAVFITGIVIFIVIVALAALPYWMVTRGLLSLAGILIALCAVGLGLGLAARMEKKYLAVAATFVLITCLAVSCWTGQRPGPRSGIAIKVIKSSQLPTGWGEYYPILENVDPIKDAIVMIYNENFQINDKTDENGRYSFKELNAGQYHIRITTSAIGETENAITIRGGEWKGVISTVFVYALYVESENRWYWYSEEIVVC